MTMILEVAYVLRGLRRLIQFDASGLAYFDRSIAGFWRSFRVALLIAPFFAIIIPYNLELIQPTASWQHVMLTEILVYIISWTLYPTAAYEICRLLSREADYPGYIVVYNWSSIILVGAEVLVWIPTLAGMTSAETSRSLEFIIYHVYLVYLWFIARSALRIQPTSAVGMVFADYILTWALSG